jgi:hypothetical protein
MGDGLDFPTMRVYRHGFQEFLTLAKSARVRNDKWFGGDKGVWF